MFEDSTFESTGSIRTRSRGWMMAAFLCNSCILLALVLFPLLYPAALPRIGMISILIAPPPPAQIVEPKPVPQQAAHEVSEMRDNELVVPTRIPPSIKYFAPGSDQPPAETFTGTDFTSGGGSVAGGTGIFASNHPIVVKPGAKETVKLSSGVVEGLLLYKNIPSYPSIARAARIEGTVVLQATIGANGTIENLHVLSGHPMLRQAALDSVAHWRYRPYELNGAPVEVETTINVIFTLGR
jgi:protein TonB